jgi:uncharacterized tellurite resistance protein B-like protein
MANKDLVTYLANIVLVSRVDGEAHALENEAMEDICRRIGARQDELNSAIEVVETSNHKPTPVGRFSDKVRNLEDMIYISVSDEKLPASQKKVILSFAKEIKVSQAQINEILYESKKRIKLQRGEVSCSSCGKEIPPTSKFCPYCGSKC